MGMCLNGGDVFQAAGGEVVQRDNGFTGVQEALSQVRADKSRSASDEIAAGRGRVRSGRCGHEGENRWTGWGRPASIKGGGDQFSRRRAVGPIRRGAAK